MPCLQGSFVNTQKSIQQIYLNFILLTEYGNIGYHSTRNQNGPHDSARLDGYDAESSSHIKSKDILNKKCDQMKPVVPIISIDLPD